MPARYHAAGFAHSFTGLMMMSHIINWVWVGGAEERVHRGFGSYSGVRGLGSYSTITVGFVGATVFTSRRLGKRRRR